MKGLRSAAAVIVFGASRVCAQDHSQHSTPTAESAETSDARATDPSPSELRHVPPDPPSRLLPEMNEESMNKLMQMDDSAIIGQWMLDRVEGYRDQGHAAIAWDTHAYVGNDYDKLWMKSEGEHANGEASGRIELLWDHVFARWWSAQTGVRRDFGQNARRTWAAIGIRGLAPYWTAVDASLYLGEEGRTAARINIEYDLLLTQRVVLQSEAEVNLYGKDDPERSIGSGLSDISFGLRLRYELRREFAPYVGIALTRHFGKTADFIRARGADSDEIHGVAGLRLWF